MIGKQGSAKYFLWMCINPMLEFISFINAFFTITFKMNIKLLQQQIMEGRSIFVDFYQNINDLFADFNVKTKTQCIHLTIIINSYIFGDRNQITYSYNRKG